MSTSWQTVSVFISSTFNDMHAERDYLVKRVFPELREWCEKRKLRLVDIDLRWGVTEEDATRHKNVVKVCLDRIDECRPFFLCFLGQRRGWVPEKSDVSKETCETYKELKGHLGNASVTELEILHAAINPLNDQDRSKYSFFYLRDDSFLKDLPHNPPLIRKTYTNESIQNQSERELADKELKIWREEKIPATGRPVHHYSATWNENASTLELRIPIKCPSSNPENLQQWRSIWRNEAGIIIPDNDLEIPPELIDKAKELNKKLSRGRLGDFTSGGKTLSAIIIDDLKKVIEERYPEHREIPYESDLQKELDQQERFLELNCSGFIKRTGDFDALDDYIARDSRDLFVLTAPGGMGKTMLLANWIRLYQQQYGSIRPVFYRFIGASEESTTIDAVLRSLLTEMKDAGFLQNEIDPFSFDVVEVEIPVEIPTDPIELKNKFSDLLTSTKSSGRCVIVIDALNQLEFGLRDLHWLPRKLPAGIQMIVSFKQDASDTENLISHFREFLPKTFHEIKPFESLHDRKKLVSAYLDQYLKQLDDSLIQALIDSPGAQNPLYLKVVLSELRIYGSFANLSEKIREDFGTTPIAAFDAVLNRLENDPSYSPVEPKIAVPLLFGLLSHTRHGLSEEELASIFLQELKLADSRYSRENQKDTIRLFLRQVRSFLAVRNGRYDFFYESFRQTAIDRYEGINKEQFQRLSTEWHLSLSEYFEQLPAWVSQKENIPTQRRAAELPYHLAWARKSDHLSDLILSYELLETIIFGIGPHAAINDISLILTPPILPKNKGISDQYEALTIIQRALRLSAHVLVQKPNQLPSQLVEKLMRIEDLIIRKFVDKLNHFDRYPWLQLVTPSLTSADGPLIRILAGHTDSIWVLAVTPDGRRVVSGSKDNTLKVWDLETGQEIHTLTGHSRSVTAVAVTPDGRRVVSGSEDNTLKVWDLETDQVLATLARHTSGITVVAVASDGRLAISGSHDQTLRVWHLKTGAEILSFTGHTATVMAVVVTPDGRSAISGSWDHTLKVWDLRTGRQLHSFIGHTAPVTEVAVTPDGLKVISGSEDATLKVWDLESGRELHALTGHTSRITALSVTPDGKLAVSGSRDHTLKVWDLENGRELHTLTSYTSVITVLSVTPDGKRVVSGSEDTTLKVWDLENRGWVPETLSVSHSGIVKSVVVTPNGCRAVTVSGNFFGSRDHTLNVWDLENGRLLATLTGHTSMVTAVAVTPDGKRAVSGSLDNTLMVWDLESGRLLETLYAHTSSVEAVCVTPNGKRAVSGSRDHTLKVWDLESGRVLETLAGDAGKVSAIVVTPEGHRVVSTSEENTLKVWNLESGRKLRTLAGHTREVTAFALTPDGLRVVSGSFDMTLKVWDLESGRVLATLTGHTGNVTALALTPDSRLAVSGQENIFYSSNKTLKVWDLKSGRELLTLAGHINAVTALVVTPDGRLTISGSSDGILKVWDLESGAIIAEFYCHAPISACGYTHQLSSIIVGDTGGRIYILRLEGVISGDPLTTAMECEDGSIHLSCFYCKKWSTLQRVDLGSEVACSLCGKKVKVNSFTYKENPFK